jgi:hypothetical protein
MDCGIVDVSFIEHIIPAEASPVPFRIAYFQESAPHFLKKLNEMEPYQRQLQDCMKEGFPSRGATRFGDRALVDI